MRILILALLTLATGCTSILTPRIDQATGTTLAQRCIDYRLTMATTEQALTLAEDEEAKARAQLAYDTARAVVDAYCALSPVSPE